MEEVPTIEIYKAKDAEFMLDPNKIFEVVSDLIKYSRTWQKSYASTFLNIMGRKINLITKVDKDITDIDHEPIVDALTSFKLAELVLNENNKDLTLKIYGHPKVAINPKDLYGLGNKYQLK